ncbi:hypothetical protein B0F90DRAFT_179895 [Multifurca ochricompacta]|nr:hypothetical protein B0F90DRAFT_179895 [Multifurca ochricompacta]
MSLKCRESRIRGVVITGQPGIGKKCFLFYLLLHRLSSGQPTAFQNHFNYFILFKDSGVEMHSRYSSLPDGTWALVDSNEEVVHPCEGFLYRSNSQTTFIVQTTFPRERRWKSWKKHRGAFLYLMDCFPWDEMHALGILLDLSVETLKNHYDKWGPSAGTLIKLTRKPWTLDMHQSRVEEIARNFAEDFNGHILGIDKMGAYHPLVTIHPKGLSPGERGVPIAEIPTEYLNLLVVDAVSTHNLDEQIKFYKLMLRSDWLFKPSVGFMFGKSLVVALLCSYYQTRWKGLGCTPLDTALPSLRIPNCRDWHLFSSNLEGLNQNTPFCLVPKTPGFPTIDVIVCTDSNRIITIQITTSASASAAAAATATNGWNAEGFTEVFNGLPTRFRKDRKWSHVFVTDKAEIAEGMRVEWEGKSVGFTVEEKWIPIEIYFRFLDLVNYRPPGDQGGSMGDEGETSEEGVDSDEEEAGLASEVVHTADLSLPVG